MFRFLIECRSVSCDMRNHPGFLLVSTVEHATSAALNASCNAPCVDPSFCPARSLHPSFLRSKSRESKSSRCCSATRMNLVRVSSSCSRSRENDAGLRSFCFLSLLAMRTFKQIAVWSEYAWIYILEKWRSQPRQSYTSMLKNQIMFEYI